MNSVAVYEAKTRLSELLTEVEAGGEVTITRRGRAVARLVPATEEVDTTQPAAQRQRVAATLAALRRDRKGVRLPGSLRESIDDGRD